MRSPLPILLACVSALLWGCTHTANDRLTLGGNYRSPSLFEPPTPPSPPAPHPGLMAATVPDRADWAPTTFLAPFDGVVHGHLLRVFPAYRSTTPPRTFGRYPTTADALDPQAYAYSVDVWYTISEYGRSSIGSDYSFFYLLSRGELFDEMLSPFPYKRSRSGAWSPGHPAMTLSQTPPGDE